MYAAFQIMFILLLDIECLLAKSKGFRLTDISDIVYVLDIILLIYAVLQYAIKLNYFRSKPSKEEFKKLILVVGNILYIVYHQ